MRTPTFAAPLAAASLLAVLGCSIGPVWAQTAPIPASQSTPQSKPQPVIQPASPARLLPAESPRDTAPSSANQRIERIQVESRDVRIDEMRFGGETRSISVTPKGGLPAYDVQPATGERTWKVLGF